MQYLAPRAAFHNTSRRDLRLREYFTMKMMGIFDAISKRTWPRGAQRAKMNAPSDIGAEDAMKVDDTRRCRQAARRCAEGSFIYMSLASHTISARPRSRLTRNRRGFLGKPATKTMQYFHITRYHAARVMSLPPRHFIHAYEHAMPHTSLRPPARQHRPLFFASFRFSLPRAARFSYVASVNATMTTKMSSRRRPPRCLLAMIFILFHHRLDAL